MLLESFHPQSKLVTKITLVNKPKFPVIDAHNHLGELFGGGWEKKPLSELLDLLDQAGVTWMAGGVKIFFISTLIYSRQKRLNVSKSSAV
jgi:hypothetical protein